MNAKTGIMIGLGGLLVGAVAGLLLAPEPGHRTRAMIKDKSKKYTHDAADFAGSKSRHIANKAKGYVNDVKGRVADRIVRRETAVMDEAEMTEA